MTKQRFDSHSTEFGLWLRNQPQIDSRLGFTATNLDYIWYDYKHGLWMTIEEKRYGAYPSYSQRKTFEVLDRACKTDRNYRGLHVVRFEKTSPEDGAVYLDGDEITDEELIAFLRFEL